VKFSDGIIAITLPAFGTGSNFESGSFRIVGIRLDVNGKTAPLTATATLDSSANNYLLSGNTVSVISALGAGIGSLTQGALSGATNNGTQLMFTNQTTGVFADPTASVVLAEGFASAWRSNTMVSTKGALGPLPNGTSIRLTVNGLPAGVTATITQVLTNTTGGTLPNVPTITLQTPAGGALGTLTSADTSNLSNVAMIRIDSANMSVVESIQLLITLGGVPTGTVSPGTITLTATHAPIGNALSGSGLPTATAPTGYATGYIRFAQADVGPVTIGTIVAANTTILIPYAVKVGAYDTGIAIANTTKDPFTTATGASTPADGTIQFSLFPRTDTGAGTQINLTTSATVRPGVGLATDGKLVAGGTWTGLVTDLLTASGTTGDFFGYIFIQTNFLNAHGAAYIFNGAGFTSGTPVLVMFPPAQFPRNAPAEVLGF
jgi:hypothetical protein